MDKELKDRIESATTPISLIGLIPEACKWGEEEIAVLYEQVKKVANTIDNQTDADNIFSNFVTHSKIISAQNYGLEFYLYRKLNHFGICVP